MPRAAFALRRRKVRRFILIRVHKMPSRPVEKVMCFHVGCDAAEKKAETTFAGRSCPPNAYKALLCPRTLNLSSSSWSQ